MVENLTSGYGMCLSVLLTNKQNKQALLFVTYSIIQSITCMHA